MQCSLSTISYASRHEQRGGSSNTGPGRIGDTFQTLNNKNKTMHSNSDSTSGFLEKMSLSNFFGKNVFLTLYYHLQFF